MKRLLRITCLSVPLVLATLPVSARAVPMPEKAESTASDLTPVLTSNSQIWESVVALPDGRLVLEAPRWLGNPAPQLNISSATNGAVGPYPDASWNAPDGDPGNRFVALTSMTLAPDGALWVVDSGVPDREQKPEAPAKLVRIDPASGKVTRVVPVSADALRSGSILSGIAIHAQTAYVADSGVPGIVVIDLESGVARRFLDHLEGLTAKRPIEAASGVVKARDGRPLAIDASLVAISPDGQWLYVQAYCGPLYRVATALFNDDASTNTAFQESATLWYKTHALGGLTIGADGTLYWSDVTTGSIDSYTPGRIPHHLITDPRLKWPGGLALSGNTIFVPAAQLDQAARFQNGQATVHWPVTVYKFRVPEDATSDVLRK
ncbi:SMP-30/gluconolactonase/LRE family protein [Acetobacter conturbans]|nr:major royal jelly family protein [Acetobacter conturbans]